jgi:hypothetical protein
MVSLLYLSIVSELNSPAAAAVFRMKRERLQL